jgi:2-hydroxy-6-oxonona-2,4-dienedioate hydrolase
MREDLGYEATSRTLQLAHGTLHYHEAGSGAALILLHGSGPGVTGWANFEGNLPLFAQDFRCFILDMPGYGKSDAAAGNPIEAAVLATIALMDELGIAEANILGNSLGAMVASYIAARHPDRVKRLCMIGGIGINIFSPFPNEGINLLVDFAEDPTRERLVSWLKSMVYDQALVTEALIEDRWARATDPKTLAVSRVIYSRAAMEALTASQFKTQPWQHLTDIVCETLLTWGRDDRVSTIDRAILPMRMIPKCELHSFPNCGHWVMIERKAEFENIVQAFFRRG